MSNEDLEDIADAVKDCGLMRPRSSRDAVETAIDLSKNSHGKTWEQAVRLLQCARLELEASYDDFELVESREEGLLRDIKEFLDEHSGEKGVEVG